MWREVIINIYSNLPEFLYKYRCFDSEGYQIQILTQNKLFCSSPKNFNDPFDCATKIDYASGTEEQRLDKLITIIKEERPNIPDNIVKKIALAKMKSPEVLESHKPEVVKQRIKSFVDNNMGVCALSERENDLLMWAHYCNSHTGFLIEFNAMNLKNFLANYSVLSKQLHMLFKVKYAENYEIINPYTENFKDKTEKFLSTKSCHWSYEKEWRIIYSNGANKCIRIPEEIFSDIINRVIIGIKINSENQKKIIEALSSKKIRIQKANQSDEKFELTYKDI